MFTGSVWFRLVTWFRFGHFYSELGLFGCFWGVFVLALEILTGNVGTVRGGMLF